MSNRILIANEMPVCEEIKRMALRRLKRLFHRNREQPVQTHGATNLSEYLRETGSEVNERSYRNLLSQQGFHAPFHIGMSELVHHEMGRDEEGNIQEVAQIPSGGVCWARNNSDRPIHLGDMCIGDERGGVRPIDGDELEELVRNPENIIVASLQEAPEGTEFIRCRVQQGNVGIITGNPSGNLSDALNNMPVREGLEALNNIITNVIQPLTEVMQPIANAVVEMTQPLAEMVEEVINDLAEGTGIPREQLLQIPIPEVDIPKYDKKYPHICFKCKQKLQYKHALGKAKDKGYTEEQHKKMWKSAIVEYYCCRCYDTKEREANNGLRNSSFYNLMERSAREVNRRWTMGRSGTLEFIDPHRILRIVDNEENILYQEEVPHNDPVFTLGFTPEVIEHQHEELRFNVRLMGGMLDGQRQYCNASSRRIVFSSLPENLRDISLAQEYPDVTDNLKLAAIAQIYLKFYMMTPLIQVGSQPHELTQPYIQRIIENPQIVIGYYDRIVQRFSHAYSEYLTQQDVMQIADHRERVIWRGYHVETNNPINQVRIHGGIVEGEQLEAVANNLEAQVNGICSFVDYHPEIINQDELNDLALSELNQRNDGIRGPLADEIIADDFEREYEQNPISPEMNDCPHHEFNEMGNCLACGIHSVQLDMMRSTRLAEHHRMGTHNFEMINGEMLCRICRLSPMEIDRNDNMQQVPRSRS